MITVTEGGYTFGFGITHRSSESFLSAAIKTDT